MAIFHTVPAKVSFRYLEAARSRQKLRDTDNQFVIDLVQTSATITWVASSGGDTFKPVTINPPVFAGVGHERNGVFFS